MNGIQYFHKFKNFEIHNNIFRCIQVNAMYIKKGQKHHAWNYFDPLWKYTNKYRAKVAQSIVTRL